MHSFATTSTNVHDVTQAHRLLHGGERQVWGDAGYIGVQKREEHLELAVQWQVAMKPGQEAETGTWGPGGNRGKGEGVYPSQGGTPLPGCEETIGLRQEPALANAGVRYRGLAKNTERLALLLGLFEPEPGPGPLGWLTQGVVGPKARTEATKRPERIGQRAEINRTINKQGNNREGKSTYAPGNQ